MTDQVRTALRDRIGEQSGFLSPTLTIFLLAVANLLPQEEEKPKTRKLTAEERAELRPKRGVTFIKERDISSATITFEDGTEIPLNPPLSRTGIDPAAFLKESEDDYVSLEIAPETVDEASRMFREMADAQVEMAAQAFGVPNSVWARDSYGRDVVLHEPHSFMGDEYREDVYNILRLYFANNPFFQYPRARDVEMHFDGRGVNLTGITPEGESFDYGYIDFMHQQVHFADPTTGRLSQRVPLHPDHWHAGQYRRVYPSGYCTPSREATLTGHGAIVHFCQCSACRRSAGGPAPIGYTFWDGPQEERRPSPGR